MPLDRQAVLDRLRHFDFAGLFTQELGWDWYTTATKVTVGKVELTLQGVAEKRGVHVFHCLPGADGRTARVVGVTGGTSTPIEDLEAVAERILAMAGTGDAAAHAHALAVAALGAAVTPAGRTSSLPSLELAPSSDAGHGGHAGSRGRRGTGRATSSAASTASTASTASAVAR